MIFIRISILKIYLHQASFFTAENIVSFDDAECHDEFMEDTTVKFNTEIDSLIKYKKWFFGHWHKDWGYDHRNESRYIPLYHEGVVVDSLK